MWGGMLQEVFVAGSASYSVAGQRLAPCRNINFVFGTNGSGKTTISRVIADPAAYPACTLTWAGGREIERLVYNSDFTARNFSSSMPGIFTLGEESADTFVKIEAGKDQRRRLEEDIRTRQTTLDGGNGEGGKVAELRRLRAEFEEKCWAIKTKHDGYFRDVFEGFRNSRTRFCDKVLDELSRNTARICSLDDLKARAASVFRKGLERKPRIAVPVFNDLLELEGDPILAKKVVGKEDVNVAALIARLGNSDWVKQGRVYLDQSGRQCPFCQQSLLTDLASSLNEYFDEAYISDIAEIDRLQQAYATYSGALLARLDQVSALETESLDNAALRADADRMAQRIELNRRQIERKKAEPSAVVTLEGLASLATAISTRLADANAAIDKHNGMVDNLAAEKFAVISEAWKCLLEESKATIDSYIKARDGLDKAIAGLNTGINQKKGALATVNAEVVALERSITSVQPTVNEINNILTSFGFTGFMLATAGESGSLYKIVRADGSDATKTLSEGEKSFITFLYFYHLIRGSVSESGITTDRVVVFDDPVSSLDSDVLFIVSALIRRVLEEACEGTGQVKQVFVLTHNIYFHKEVSFDPKRGKECRAHETFWIVRRLNNESVIVGYDHNPIKTSYELLWGEVRNPNRSNLTIQNALRRILESYFKILGNLDRDEIVAMFDGRDKQICGSLFSWVNDGSHAVHDDLYISADDAVVERYLDVFRRIFDKTQHIGHYKMMMGLEPSAERTPPVIQVAA
jgi:wobble nucleotide-excising tRNase